jgi:hypothetical protein
MVQKDIGSRWIYVFIFTGERYSKHYAYRRIPLPNPQRSKIFCKHVYHAHWQLALELLSEHIRSTKSVRHLRPYSRTKAQYICCYLLLKSYCSSFSLKFRSRQALSSKGLMSSYFAPIQRKVYFRKLRFVMAYSMREKCGVS